MNKANGASGQRHGLTTNTAALATCPTCKSPITHEEYERILQISEARHKQHADERAAIECEREKIVHERAKIEQSAVKSEREKWEADASRTRLATEREVERLRKEAEVSKERLARTHEKEIQAEVRRREATEKKLAREVAIAQAKAKAEAEVRIRDAKRAVEEKQNTVVDGLRDQLKTLEQRRRRDEDTLKQTISQLQQKAEVRDSAHFGPEGEEELVQVLREHFPGDRIEHRGKAGDVLHKVIDAGKVAGTIVYECKKTKGFQRAYLRQTKLAMESHGTRYGLLVSRALPARQSGMCVLSGVIVAVPAIVSQVVAVLRDGIITISRLRLSQEGSATKAAALIAYLRCEEFSNAIQRVTEKVGELRDSLTRERSSHDGWWRTREQQYAAILREASGIDARVNDLLGTLDPVPARAKALGVNDVEPTRA